MIKLLAFVVVIAAAVSATPIDTFNEVFLGNGRIVNGEDTDISIIPHQVGLSINKIGGTYGCGGSILNTNTILTAAHCTEGSSAPGIRVYAGYTKRAQAPPRSVKELFIHANYISTAYGYDISILKLTDHLVYSHTIRAVNLPPPGYNVPENTLLTVSGWGNLQSGGSSPEVLQSTQVLAWTNEACDAKYTNYTIFPHQICAGKPGFSSCQGDSGGPLTQYVGESRAIVLGIVSYGYYCGTYYHPTVYVRVSSFLDWITTLMER